MKRKNIKSLMGSRKIVYVKLSNEQVADAFFALARYEGFTLIQEITNTDTHEKCFVKLNDNMTISYPTYHTWIGAIKFHYAKMENGKRVVKIDFEKML